MIIFTDFDGTITQTDTLNMVLDRFASGNWRAIEDRVSAHQLTEKDALQAEFDLVHVELEKATQYLQEHADIDHTFLPFVDWCKKNTIELIVLSGGFKEFIKVVFSKFGIKDVPFFSNTLLVKNKKWIVIPSLLPKIKNLCNHCKTYHLNEAKKNGHQVVYIGDGNTDRCPAENADVVFAKDNLQLHFQNLNKSFYKYNSFSDVQKQLERIICK